MEKALATWEEYRNTARVCRDVTRKSKAILELNLAADVKNNKKSFFKYINRKRNTRQNGESLLNELSDLATGDTEKQFLNALFGSVFTAKGSPLSLEVRKTVWKKEES